MTYYWANPSGWPTSDLTPKVEFGASRAHMLVHRLAHSRAVWRDGRFTVQAQWLCGDGAQDVVLLGSVAEGGAECSRCVAAGSGAGVYRCFDASGRLLYIGSSKCVAMRLRGHESTSPWWPDVARTEVESHDNVLSARAAEARAIPAEQPLYNKMLRGHRQHHEPATA